MREAWLTGGFDMNAANMRLKQQLEPQAVFGGYRAELLWLAPLFTMSVTLVLIAELLSYMNGTSAVGMIYDYGAKALRLLPLVGSLGILCLLAVAVVRNHRTAVDQVIIQIRDALSNPYMIAARLSPILMMPFFFASFSVLKMLMPRYVPFWLDEPFARLDQILFFGYHPWQITHAVFTTPEATVTIDLFYSVWVLLLSVAIAGFALFAPRTERARFFLSFGGAWFFLGFIGAWLGSSAGPCFLANLNSPLAPEFAGLMQRLHAASNSMDTVAQAVEWQEMLWSGYESQTYRFGMGISAMPSLHNAIAVLYAIIAFRFGKIAGWVFTAYAIIIFIGSIHLGWHYAVDGIFSAVGMWAIWRAADKWCINSGYDAAVRNNDETRGTE